MARSFLDKLTWIGVVVVVMSLLLAADLVWEATVLTWDRGPQMVGWSLTHGAGGILVLALLGGLVWIAAAAIFAALSRSMPIPIRILVILYGLAWVLVEAPYGFWQRLFIEKLAHGAHAAQFLTYAAALGDLQTVEALLSHGVPVDARDQNGRTALNRAALAGQSRVVNYLLANGADVNAQ
jgi:Ankyrin repeats (3 copies)